MKKYIALFSLMLLLSACGTTPTDDSMMEDHDDDAMMMDDHDGDEMMEDHDAMMDDGTVMGETHEDAGGDGTNGDAMMEGARVIEVTAEDWAFAPEMVSAKKDEKVVLRITSASGGHGLGIPDLGLNVKIPEGQTVDVLLPTDKVGTFGGFCSVPCGKGHKDMHLSVVISE